MGDYDSFREVDHRAENPGQSGPLDYDDWCYTHRLPRTDASRALWAVEIAEAVS